MSSHFAQRQFRYEQFFLCPRNPEIMPWFLHRAHFGTRPLIALFWLWCDADDGVNCLCFSLFVAELIEIDIIFAQFKWNFNFIDGNTQDSTCSLTKIEMQTKSNSCEKCNRIVVLSFTVSNRRPWMLLLFIQKAYQNGDRLSNRPKKAEHILISNVCPALTLKLSIQIIDEAHASFNEWKQNSNWPLNYKYFISVSNHVIIYVWSGVKSFRRAVHMMCELMIFWMFVYCWCGWIIVSCCMCIWNGFVHCVIARWPNGRRSAPFRTSILKPCFHLSTIKYSSFDFQC